MKRWLRYLWENETWIIKFFLLIVFAFNLGLPQGCVRTMLHESKNGSRVIYQEELELKRFMFQKVNLAEQKVASCDPYSPYDYFRDLGEYYVKKKELGLPDGFCPELDKLMNLMRVSHSSKSRFTSEDIERARNAYAYLIPPEERIPREELTKEMIMLGLYGVLAWFFWLYLKTIPVILILYLIWMRDERHENRDYGPFKFPKPGRFLLLLAGYPLVLGYYIVRWFRLNGRHVYAEAELRRSKRLFAYISEEDLEKIKGFAKSNLSLSEWRKQLKELGFKPRHSLMSALLVTLVFVFIIRPVEASAKSLKNFAKANVALEQIEATKNLARGNIETEKFQRGNNCGGNKLTDCRDATIEMAASRKPASSFLLVISKIILPLTEFLDSVDHIPILAVHFELTSPITHC